MSIIPQIRERRKQKRSHGKGNGSIDVRIAFSLCRSFSPTVAAASYTLSRPRYSPPDFYVNPPPQLSGAMIFREIDTLWGMPL